MSSAIIVDCFNLGWSCGFAMQGLEHEGQPTNVLYGFFRSLLQAGKYIKTPVTMVFAWDSRKSRRKLIFPEYKKKRAERFLSNEDVARQAAIHNQLDILKDDILLNIGFKNHLHKTGYEADDIIACVSQQCDFDEVLIVSTDNDLLQLLDDNVSIYSPKTSKLMTKLDFVDKYKIQPSEWALVKAMAGCSSDEVPGIPGIAEKSALDYLTGNLSATKVRKIELAMLTSEVFLKVM